MDSLEYLYDEAHPESKGYWSTEIVVKESAIGTIDDITKFAYYDDDYEKVNIWHEYTQEELDQQKAAKEQEEKRQQEQLFLDNGPQDVEDLKVNQEDIILTMADIIGGGM